MGEIRIHVVKLLGNMINGKWTINQARGVSKYISNRTDLTFECIRKYYHGEFEPNQLPKTVDEYLLYKDRVTDFVRYRNERIEKWSQKQSNLSFSE